MAMVNFFMNEERKGNCGGRQMSIVTRRFQPATFFYPMKKTKLLFPVLAAVAFAGCSTVDSRIAKDQPAFDSWPPAVQQKVRAKQVDLGFTPAQVLVALGGQIG